MLQTALQHRKLSAKQFLAIASKMNCQYNAKCQPMKKKETIEILAVAHSNRSQNISIIFSQTIFN
jgi:hypothetical protein